MSDLLAFRSEKIWRWLTNFWTLVFLVFMVVNFFLINRFDFLTAPFSVIYVGVLGLYVGTKEFDRWYDMHESRHPGEIAVVAWTAIIFGLMVTSIFLQNGYQVSSESIAVYIMVLSVFALTQKSKKLHQRKKSSR